MSRTGINELKLVLAMFEKNERERARNKREKKVKGQKIVFALEWHNFSSNNRM